MRESLVNSQWCLIRTTHNFPFLSRIINKQLRLLQKRCTCFSSFLFFPFFFFFSFFFFFLFSFFFFFFSIFHEQGAQGQARGPQERGALSTCLLCLYVNPAQNASPKFRINLTKSYFALNKILRSENAPTKGGKGF